MYALLDEIAKSADDTTMAFLTDIMARISTEIATATHKSFEGKNVNPRLKPIRKALKKKAVSAQKKESDASDSSGVDDLFCANPKKRTKAENQDAFEKPKERTSTNWFSTPRTKNTDSFFGKSHQREEANAPHSIFGSAKNGAKTTKVQLIDEDEDEGYSFQAPKSKKTKTETPFGSEGGLSTSIFFRPRQEDSGLQLVKPSRQPESEWGGGMLERKQERAGEIESRLMKMVEQKVTEIATKAATQTAKKMCERNLEETKDICGKNLEEAKKVAKNEMHIQMQNFRSIMQDDAKKGREDMMGEIRKLMQGSAPQKQTPKPRGRKPPTEAFTASQSYNLTREDMKEKPYILATDTAKENFKKNKNADLQAAQKTLWNSIVRNRELRDNDTSGRLWAIFTYQYGEYKKTLKGSVAPDSSQESDEEEEEPGEETKRPVTTTRNKLTVFGAPMPKADGTSSSPIENMGMGGSSFDTLISHAANPSTSTPTPTRGASPAAAPTTTKPAAAATTKPAAAGAADSDSDANKD
jgi:hypothetical protein